MKDKLKDLVPIPVHVFNREMTRIIAEIKKEFITHFNMHKSLNDETQNNIHSLSKKTDEINEKLEKLENLENLENLDRIYQKVSHLDSLSKLDNLDSIEQKLENLDKIIDKLGNLDDIIQKLDKLEQLEELNTKLSSFQDSISKLDQLDQLNKLNRLNRLEDINAQLESNKASIDILHNLQNNIKSNVAQNKLTVNETLWANVFNNTIQNSTWLPTESIITGRGEMGYPALYLLYRVLNEFKPKSILEFGLGQATKMVNHYANSHKSVKHDVIENDLYWIEFFTNHYPLTNKSHLVQLEYELIEYKKGEKIRVFSEFREKYEHQTFDLIVIDAPLGGEMKPFARIDILSILPSCLNKDFVIILDDYDRPGEKNTVKDIEDIFNENKIPFHKAIFSGKKDTIIIVSKNLKFLSLM